MSEVRFNLEPRPLLQDDDCDITEEYDNIVESALDIRRQFSLLVTQARRLKKSCWPKKRRSTALTLGTNKGCRTSSFSPSTYARRCKRKVTDCSRTERQCGYCVAATRSLPKTSKLCRKNWVDFLRCDVCKDTIQNVVTKCGHRFCKRCLDRWLHQPASLYTGRTEKSCPNCRRIIIGSEIRDVYFGLTQRLLLFSWRTE